MMPHLSNRTSFLGTVVWLSQVCAAAASPIVFSTAGPNPAAVQAEVASFTAGLGANNGVGPCAGCTGGFRNINWDGVPDVFSTPNLFPGDFFNQPGVGGRVRGLTVSTPGTGFTNSANVASGLGVNFTDRNAGYAGQFQTFSAQRLFSAVDSVYTDVSFSVPGTPEVAGLTRGFGVVFSDVDTDTSTSLAFYGLDGTLLYTAYAAPYDMGLSFLGVLFDTDIVARVRIASGSALLGQLDDVSGATGRDAVVMDDFFYGEPQAAPVPEPATLGLLGLGALLAGPRLRRR